VSSLLINVQSIERRTRTKLRLHMKRVESLDGKTRLFLIEGGPKVLLLIQIIELNLNVIQNQCFRMTVEDHIKMS
jgi:hypothetical protein